jgi:uncharacterized protein DUF222
MSMLRSALEEIRTEDVAGMDDEGLEAEFAELDRAADVIDAKRLRVLCEIERRGTYARDGYLSVTSWLAQRFRKTWSAASRLVRASRALEQMPGTREALDEGEITSSAVELLTSAREVDPEAFAQAEHYLVEAASTLAIPDLRRVVATWRQAADDARGTESSQRAHERRRLHVSPTLAGMVRVDADLDPETGQTVISPPFGPCATQRWETQRMPAPPHSVGPMPWARSAASGLTQPIVPWWEASVPTSRSRWTLRPSRDARPPARWQRSRMWARSLRRQPGAWPVTPR